MKRTAIFPISLILFCCSLFPFSISAQTVDPAQVLVGQWEGPNAPFQGRAYSLTVVFAYDDNGLKVIVSRNAVNEAGRRDPGFTVEPPYYAVEPRSSPKGTSFTLTGTKRAAFYEGMLSSNGADLTIFFSAEPPSEKTSKISWNLKRRPICNRPEELAAASRDLWADRRFSEVNAAMSGCLSLGLYEDKNSLIWGLLVLKDPGAYDSRYSARYGGALTNFNKSIKLNPQNPVAYYARAFIHHERALEIFKKVSAEIEANNKQNERYPTLSWTAQQIEQKKEAARRESILAFNDVIGDYGWILYNDAFERDAYVKRAQTYYLMWSKYEPNLEYLKNALKDYKAAIDLDPLSSALFYERSKIYKYLGDEEKAEADRQKAAELKVNKISPNPQN
jgi:tetratricopeptide (TPR) repeat protein